EERRMRALERLRDDRDGAHDPVLDARAVAAGGLEIPRRLAGRDAPVAALVREQLVRPRLLDDAEAFLERGAIRLVDRVVLVGEGAVDAVRLLRHHVDPATLVAAREAGVRTPAGHVI